MLQQLRFNKLLQYGRKIVKKHMIKSKTEPAGMTTSDCATVLALAGAGTRLLSTSLRIPAKMRKCECSVASSDCSRVIFLLFFNAEKNQTDLELIQYFWEERA